MLYGGGAVLKPYGVRNGAVLCYDLINKGLAL